ncbi:PhzF family phenazine biosynthesis protein [Massilia sp. TWP1-3-3]|uniref:PhzF family phenazine biosynthesis protein n=1 Tax=Massilia sp. TWP1-3-3 TaxID=2804573 RepID=UPI003CF1BFFC
MQVALLRCFGAVPGKGNIAQVIEDGPVAVAQRQLLARESGHSATVFLTPPAGERGAWVADFYYPHARSVLCLHASLAAAHVLCSRQPGTPVVLETAMRSQLLTLARDGEALYASVRRQAVAPVGIAPGLPARLLGEPGLRLAAPALLSSVGSPKLLIEVADRAALYALTPPLADIVAWSKENGVNGCYVYCRTGEREYEGRNFNHPDPAGEDSATGVAAGALSAWLGHGLVVLQGALLGNPCRMVTRIDGKDIFVGGATEVLAQ